MNKILALAIAIVTMGAQIVCGCPDLAVVKQAPPALAPTCVGERECCHKIQSQSQAPPQKQEPCEKCNFKHRTQQAMPDRQDSSMPALALYAVPVSLEIIPLADSSNHSHLADGNPSPPLLEDLFHVHSLLLN